MSEYLRKSMFHGLSEVADEKPLHLKLFWLVAVSAATVVCFGFVVKITLGFCNQTAEHRVVVQQLLHYPNISVCLDPLRSRKAAQGDMLMKLSTTFEDTSYCAQRGVCNLTFVDMADSGTNFTASDFESKYLLHVGKHSSFIHQEVFVFRPNCLEYDCKSSPYLAFNFSHRMNQVFGFFCRDQHIAVAPQQGRSVSKTLLQLDPLSFDAPSGPLFEIQLSYGYGERSHFLYHALHYSEVAISYRLKSHRRIRNCQDLKHTALRRKRCKYNILQERIGCCLCGGPANGVCSRHDRCCAFNEIPVKITDDLDFECGSHSDLPVCEVKDFEQTSVEFSFFSGTAPRDVNKSHILAVALHFDDISVVMVVEEYFPITLSETVAMIGGIFSLFIGGSIVAVVHLFYYFCAHVPTILGRGDTDTEAEVSETPVESHAKITCDTDF